jgi:hypothetical protein
MIKIMLVLSVLLLLLPVAAADCSFTENISVSYNWNDISFNILPDNRSLKNVLSSINGNFSTIKTLINGNPLFWDERAPNFLNSLHEINYSLIYRINMKEDSIIQLVGCPDPSVPYWVNTTWTEWYNYESCNQSDFEILVQNLTQYDYNNRNETNSTFYNYNITECNFCQEDIQGPLYTDCTIYDNRTAYYFDNNYESCCALTNLESDCHINNGSYHNFTDVCDYCKPNITIAWSNDWYNLTDCLPDNTQIQTMNGTEYDSNYTNCYLITGLENDFFINKSVWQNRTIDCSFISSGPSIDSITIDGQSYLIKINPKANDVRTVNVSVDVSHPNGFYNISNVSITTPNEGLVILNNVGNDGINTAYYEGHFDMNYYENPGFYTMNITAYDTNGFYNESSKEFEYMSLAAIILENDNIVFQTVYPNMSTINSTSVKNAGNVDVNLSVCGDDFVLDLGHTISVGNLLYRFEGYGFLELSKIPYVYGLNLGLNDWINLYLNLTVPIGTMPGKYNSNINITAVSG